MLRWEDAGCTGIVLGVAPPGEQHAVPAAVPDFVRDCAVPLVVCSGALAAVRGTATLIRTGKQIVLLTAAHLFDHRVRLGDLMLPLPASGAWLNLDSAQVRCEIDADIAVIRPDAQAQAALAKEWRAVPLEAVAGAGLAVGEDWMHYVAGYPAALTRLHEQWLVAKRLLVMSGELAPGSPAGESGRDLLLEYRRVAARTDGQSIHTPPLDGVSGAAVWGVRCFGGRRHLMIVGVQSSFCHSRYLRAHRVTPLQIR